MLLLVALVTDASAADGELRNKTEAMMILQVVLSYIFNVPVSLLCAHVTLFKKYFVAVSVQLRGLFSVVLDC